MHYISVSDRIRNVKVLTFLYYRLPITDYLIGNFHEAVTNGSKSLPGTSSDILSLIRVNEGFDIL